MSTSRRLDPTAFQSSLELVPEQYCIALAGGRGGGKTWGAIRLILRHCQRGEARVLVTRRRLKSLQQFAHEMRMLSGAAWNGQDSTFTFGNGATVTLAHCESEAALLDIAQGMSYSLIVVDEAGVAPAMSVIDELMLALRSPTLPTRVLLLANPGGTNHTALAQRHVLGRQHAVPYTLGARTWVSMFSTVDDNPHLPAEYHANFEQLRLSDPARYEAMRHGRWDRLVGQYLEGIWTHKRIVPARLAPPPEAFKSLRIGADWGTASPAPFLLGGRMLADYYIEETDQLLPRNSWLLLDEHVEHDPRDVTRGTGRGPRDIAPALLAMCRRHACRARGVIDSAANARTQGRGQRTVSELFAEQGIRLAPAYKRGTRADRCLALRELMSAGEFHVVDRCRYWLATVPALPRDEHDPEVPDTAACDHAWDASLYLVGTTGTEVSVGRYR